MERSRHAALSRAVSAASAKQGRLAYTCERLEPRLLLDADDPVLVLVEPIQEYFDIP